ncbi:MAG: RHS repeat-associated core domain-containing protein [Pseudonocardiales bacterium]
MLRRHKTLSGKTRVWHYTWDPDDRLTTVTIPDGQRWRYSYDPLGRRIAKQHLTPDDTTVLEQIDFTWDGATLAEQTHTRPDHPDGSTTTWNFEPGSFRPLTQTERTPLRDAPQDWIDQQFHAIITNLIGTPTELVDPNGNLTRQTHTSLWGIPITPEQRNTLCPLRFPGQYNDPETGLHYNFHRYYLPEIGRFGSEDPLGLAGGINSHAYVPNPTAWLDPLGLTPCSKQLAANTGDTYYRAMSPAHFDELTATGRLPATSETFISPTRQFSEAYDGVLVEFSLRRGTTDALVGVGVRDPSAATAARFPDMPLVSRGWAKTSAFFKGEGSQINIGLGSGTALDIFNEGIIGFRRLS